MSSVTPVGVIFFGTVSKRSFSKPKLELQGTFDPAAQFHRYTDFLPAARQVEFFNAYLAALEDKGFVIQAVLHLLAEFFLDKGRDIDICDGHFPVVGKPGRRDVKIRSQGPVRSPPKADPHADQCLPWWFIDAAAVFQVDRTQQLLRVSLRRFQVLLISKSS